MSTINNPSEIARETLKSLAARKIAPTPDNYAQVYQEISGIPISKDNNSSSPISANLPLAWPNLIRELLKQLETTHKGITITRKKEGVEMVMTKFSNNPESLYEKLQGLIRSWTIAPTTANLSETVPTITPPTAVATAPSPSNDAAMSVQLRELLAQTLESSLSMQPDLSEEIQAFARRIRASLDQSQMTNLANDLRQFWIKQELRGGDKIKIQEGLERLLRLLIENVSELVSNDQWLHGQISTLQEIISHPIDKRSIADAERNLRDAIIKQGQLKQSLSDAKSTLKSLMTTFIDRLEGMTISTDEYHTKITDYSLKISRADNITELGHILDDIMNDTREIQASTQSSNEAMISARKQAEEADERVKQLEQELTQVSELVHEDHLTGALNRRGMEETLEREVKRADRHQTPISIALLDVDNFKQLNDTLGHQAGDLALVFLANTIKETLRPTDDVARYGGEEFLIIMPGATIEEANGIITRVQRELTKKLFMHENQRLLITFSAGVAQRNTNEDQQDIIGRADKAMYQAKLTGKNQVAKAV